jgi:hypothetical protein
VALGLIVGMEPGRNAARIDSRARVKIRDVFGDWPPETWAADDLATGNLTSAPGELRLLWFSTPDADGWFRVTATDPRGASWTTYCRTPTENLWPTLERALGGALRKPLDLVGEVALESTARPKAS